MRGRDVLDVGCGEGALVRRLIAKGARAVGVEPLPGAIVQARREDASDSPARYLQGKAEALAFPDASFDVVIFFNSLHHVPVQSMDAALAEAARVLRRDGVLYVQEPLAEGSAFELLHLVEDETPTRAAAQQALGRALQGRFVQLACRETLVTVHHADFSALRRHMLSVEPARAAAVDEHERSLRDAFERLGRRCESGFEFDQPLRTKLLSLAE